MGRGVRIPSFKKVSSKKDIIKYIKPKYIYIPLVIQNDTNITALFKKDDYVHKGDIVAKSKGKFRVFLHSSVSGRVIDTVDKHYYNGQLVKCLMIENDFKEKVAVKKTNNKTINHFTKEEFINKLKACGIVGLGGAGFPVYIKFDTDKKLKTLIINAVECEPYITADYALIKEKCEEILETIDAIMEINDISEGIIAIKKGDSELKNIIRTFIGTYIKIRLIEVPNLYPMGWERALIKEVKGVNYKKLPIEKGIIVNNISTIYAIYEALKYDKPLLERVITVTGEMVKEPHNVLVKIGTSVDEVIKSLGGYKKFKDIKFIAGGPMMGVAIKNDDLIITPNVSNVLVIRDYIEELPIECFRCGKCVEVCPAKIAPVLIKDNLKKSDVLKELKPELCIECGLCSYICPSKINVRLCVINAKRILKEGENK